MTTDAIYQPINETYFDKLTRSQLRQFFDRLFTLYTTPATKANALLFCCSRKYLGLLHLAIKAGHLNALDMLFEINGREVYRGENPADWAVTERNDAVLLHLITKYGMMPIRKIPQDETPALINTIMVEALNNKHQLRLTPYRNNMVTIFKTAVLNYPMELISLVIDYYLPMPNEFQQFKTIFQQQRVTLKKSARQDRTYLFHAQPAFAADLLALFREKRVWVHQIDSFIHAGHKPPIPLLMDMAKFLEKSGVTHCPNAWKAPMHDGISALHREVITLRRKAYLVLFGLALVFCLHASMWIASFFLLFPMHFTLGVSAVIFITMAISIFFCAKLLLGCYNPSYDFKTLRQPIPSPTDSNDPIVLRPSLKTLTLTRRRIKDMLSLVEWHLFLHALDPVFLAVGLLMLLIMASPFINALGITVFAVAGAGITYKTVATCHFFKQKRGINAREEAAIAQVGTALQAEQPALLPGV